MIDHQYLLPIIYSKGYILDFIILFLLHSTIHILILLSYLENSYNFQ